MSKNFEFRVLAGLQAGARATLGDTRQIIGSDDACDLILAGDGIAPRHAAVTASESGIVLEVLDGPVRKLDGSEVTGQVSLNEGEPIRLGAVVIGIGSPDQEWPPMESFLPSRPAEEPMPAAAAAAAADVAIRPEPAPSAAPPKRQRSMFMLAAPAIGFVAIVGALTAIFLSGGQEVPEQTPVTVSGEDRARAVAAKIRELGMAERLSVRNLDEHTVIVSGYLESASQRTSVAQKLRLDGVEVALRVWAEDQMVETATALIRPIAPGVEVTSVSPGVLRLSGYADDAATVERVMAAVRDDVPGVRDAENRIITRPELIRVFERTVLEHGLAGRVKLAMDGGAVVASGTLAEKDVEAWNTALAKFQRAHGTRLEIRTAFTPRTEELPFAIRSIVRGPLSYVTTTSGRRVGEGGELHPAYRLVAIRDGELEIERDGQTFIHRLEQKGDNGQRNEQGKPISSLARDGRKIVQ